jgi:antitoxin PrlF
MPAATMTSKGQITVPKVVREALALHPGDRIAFRINDDGTVTMEPETVDLLDLKGALKARVTGVTIEAMNAAVRESAAGRKRKG